MFFCKFDRKHIRIAIIINFYKPHKAQGRLGAFRHRVKLVCYKYICWCLFWIILLSFLSNILAYYCKVMFLTMNSWNLKLITTLLLSFHSVCNLLWLGHIQRTYITTYVNFSSSIADHLYLVLNQTISFLANCILNQPSFFLFEFRNNATQNLQNFKECDE